MANRRAGALEPHAARQYVRAAMPSGTLAISKTGTGPATYRMTFIPNFSDPRLGLGTLTIVTVEELRVLLTSIGIIGSDRDHAIRAVLRDNVAILRDVVLTDEFMDQHRL